MAKYKQKEMIEPLDISEQFKRPRRYGGRKHTYKPIPKMRGCKDC